MWAGCAGFVVVTWGLGFGMLGFLVRLEVEFDFVRGCVNLGSSVTP